MTIVSEPATRFLDVDAPRLIRDFGRRPFYVEHHLREHPLLTVEAIADLADTLPLASVERHRADLPRIMPGGASEVEGKPSETARNIEHNGCWMVLWYIERVPEYKALLDGCLDELAAVLGRRDGGMRQREAFLFLSAPNAVTPAHFDPEHNLLLQIRGAKDMHVGRFADPAEQQGELDRYHDGGHRNLDHFPEDAETFHLTPGQGVYVWPWAPHWVQNSPAVSVSLSITFRTGESASAERVHRLNARLRRLRMSPRPAGAAPPLDRAKAAAMAFIDGARRRATRARAHS